MRSGRRDPRHTGGAGWTARARDPVRSDRARRERGSATLGGDGGDHRIAPRPRGSRRRGRRRARQEASQRTTVHVTQHLPSRPRRSRGVSCCARAPAPPPGGSTTSDLRVVQGRRAARKFGVFRASARDPQISYGDQSARCPTVAFSRRFPDLPLPGAPRSRGEIRRRGLRALERAHVNRRTDGAAPQQCSSRDPRERKQWRVHHAHDVDALSLGARSRLGSWTRPARRLASRSSGHPSQPAPWFSGSILRAAAGPVPPRGRDEEGQGEEEEQDRARYAPGTNLPPCVGSRSSFRRPATTRSPIDDVPPPASRVARRRESQPPTPMKLTHPSLAFQEFIEKDNEKDQLAAAMREAARSARRARHLRLGRRHPRAVRLVRGEARARSASKARRFARRAPPPPRR